MRFLLLLLAIPGLAQDFGPLRQFIQSRLTADTVPSIAVAVAKDGRIIWEAGFGWANREQRIPATEHIPYSLASISKPITATGLMVLVGQGKVDLDAPIDNYIAPARLTAKTGSAEEATVTRVASHTAGLPLHYQFFYQDEMHQPPAPEETIRRYGILVTPPGERYEYSNLGFGILDYLITRVSGRPYADFMREEVFAPLGLSHTAIGIPPGAGNQHAVRYGPDQLPIPFYDFDHRGASAVYSSAHDLVRFGMFHLKTHLADQKAVLSDDAIDRMQRVVNAGGKPIPYAVGWSVVERDGVRVVSHSGGMGGVSTLLTLVPSQKLAIAVLANAQTGMPGEVTRRVRTLLTGGAANTGGSSGQQQSALHPSPDWVRTWKGKLITHGGSHDFELRIARTGEIHARMDFGLWTLLNRVSYRDGYLRGVMMGDVQTPDASRRTHQIHITLKMRGDVLCGPASAISMPGKRAGNALSSWLEVR